LIWANIDKNFDKFELYVFRNIFSVPKDVILPNETVCFLMFRYFFFFFFFFFFFSHPILFSYKKKKKVGDRIRTEKDVEEVEDSLCKINSELSSVNHFLFFFSYEIKIIYLELFFFFSSKKKKISPKKQIQFYKENYVQLKIILQYLNK